MAESTDNLVLTILRDIRKEQAEHRTLLLGVVESLRRLETRSDKRSLGLETRLGEMRDDLELMLKSELLGSRAHFETAYDHKLEALAERLAALEDR